jgi:hypothetical protein
MTDGWVGEAIHAPDLIGPLFGYRTWTVTLQDGEPRLASVLHQTVYWPTSYELRAQHMGGGNLRNSHDAPLTGCQCGIYAWDTADRLRLRGGGAWLGHSDGTSPSLLVHLRLLGRKPDPQIPELSGVEIKVAGRVALWGRVFRHTYGYRAEYAKAVALVAPSGASRPLLEALARSYRLDLLPSIEAA